MRRGFLNGREHVGQVCISVAAPHRSADSQEDDISPGDGWTKLAGESEATGRHVALQQRVEARLVDRRAAGLELS